MKALLTIALAAALAACAGDPGTIVRDRPVIVHVPVTQPCASQRPDAVKPLNQRLSAADWAARNTGQKAALVAAQGLDRLTYGEQLDAATAACATAEPPNPTGQPINLLPDSQARPTALGGRERSEASPRRRSPASSPPPPVNRG